MARIRRTKAQRADSLMDEAAFLRAQAVEVLSLAADLYDEDTDEKHARAEALRDRADALHAQARESQHLANYARSLR